MIEGSDQIGKVGYIPKQFKNPNFLRYNELGACTDVGIRDWTLEPLMIDNEIGGQNLIQLSTGERYNGIVGVDIIVRARIELQVTNNLGFDILSNRLGLRAFKREGGIDGFIENQTQFTIPANSTITRIFNTEWDIQAENWQNLYELYPWFRAQNVTVDQLMITDIFIELL